MKPTNLFLISYFLFLISFSAIAQPTITFTPSEGTTLTRSDVDDILAANGLDRESEFHAIIENTTLIAPGDDNSGTGVFQNCKYLLSVDLTDVKTIETAAFYGCDRLTSAIGPNVTDIGGRSFYECSSLSTISFPNAKNI